MVKKRKLPFILIIIAIILIAGGVIIFIVNKDFVFDSKNHEQLDTGHVYIADVYKKLAIRRDAFVDAEVIAVIDDGTELRIVGEGKGPMIEIETDDKKRGFVQKKYIVQKGVKTLRSGKNAVAPSKESIYYIKRASSIVMGSYYTEDIHNSVVLEYLIRGTPVQILDNSNNAMQVISCESGTIGYIENDMSLLSKSSDLGIAEGYTPDGKRLAKDISDEDIYEYPVNNAEDVFIYQSANNCSEIIKRLGPGSWVTVEDDNIRNGYVKIKEAYGDKIGYIDVSYLYYG